MEHPEFYTLATTVVIVFMLGGIYIVGRADAEGVGGWRLAFLCITNIVPGAIVINLVAGSTGL
jgi:hypothetical protein